MANIRVDSPVPVYDGQPLTFKSPKGCAEVTGLIVYYPNGDTTNSKVFQFSDAHGNDVGGKDLFGPSVLVRVILDTELNRAYIQNADTNAYLENILSNHTHSLSDITGLETLLSGAAKVQTGSYTGTSTVGQSNPCSLTFNFEPKFVFITVESTANAGELMFAVRGCSSAFSTDGRGSNSTGRNTATWSGNTLSWYHKDNAMTQMNYNGYKYYWVAIG